MSYTITLTDGSVFATIPDGTINTSSSMTLVGKNYAGYGQFLDNNFVRSLENASNSTAPGAPLTGQLWWNNTPNAGILSVYMGSAWKTLSALAVSSSTPSTSTYGRIGDMWYDTTNQQVNIWTGTSWLLVGPQFNTGTGVTGAFANVITDTGSQTHKVIELVVNSTVVGIVSEDTSWIPQVTIPGFGNVNPGIQLANTVTGVGGSSVPAFWGSGNVGVSVTGNVSGNYILGNGSLLTGLANISGNISTTGNITGNYILGNGSQLSGLSGLSGNISTTGNITGGFILGNGSQLTGLAATYGNANVANFLPTFSGTVGATALTTGANTTAGTITGNWSLSAGSRLSATYADVAERFAADAVYEAGTVVELGGSQEITRSLQDLSETVFGVISMHAAYLMNSGAGDDATHPPVAMTGRVPVQCTGVVHKGDRLVSAGNGIARSAQPGEATAFNTIGRALVDKLDLDLGTVEAIVTIK